MHKNALLRASTGYICSQVKESIGNMHERNFVSFEDLKTIDDHGVTYWSARDLMCHLGYKKWSNFSGVIRRAIGIIKHKHIRGEIVETSVVVRTGYNARREIVDYLIDADGVSLLNELCSSFKLNNFYLIRNETVVLQLVEKYCQKKDVDFQYQYRIGKFVFDCKVGNNILLEFDEPHHQINTRQKEIDDEKNIVAKAEGFSLKRVDLETDIIDIIVYLEAHLGGEAMRAPTSAAVITKADIIRLGNVNKRRSLTENIATLIDLYERSLMTPAQIDAASPSEVFEAEWVIERALNVLHGIDKEAE